MHFTIQLGFFLQNALHKAYFVCSIADSVQLRWKTFHEKLSEVKKIQGA